MNNRLSIQDLASILSAQTGKSEEEAFRFLQEFIAVVSDGVYNDKLVKVKGLGTFKIIRVEERASVSVNSGERFVIPSHFKFTFTPDKELKELVNKPFSLFDTVELNENVNFSDVDVSSELNATEETSDESSEEILPDMVPANTPEETKEVDVPEKEEEPVAVSAAPVIENQADLVSSEPEQAVGNGNKSDSDEEQIVPEKPTIVSVSKVEKKHFKRSKLLFPLACLLVILVLGIIYIVCLSGRPTFNYTPQKLQAEVADSVVRTDSAVSADFGQVEMVDSTITATDTIVAPVTTVAHDEDRTKSDVLALVTIKAGDRLASFAKQYFGHKFFWVYIYDFNKDIIEDPNNIPIGTELRIPDPGLYGIDSTDRSSIDKAAALQSQILSKYSR